jgi:predicted lipid-binding transport protein (Tim44 family)
MGPVAGLAAGLGLAALASHLGMGEAFANMLMVGLLVMAALALFAFVMRKRAMAAQGGSGLAGAGGMGRVQDVAYRQAASGSTNGASAGGSMIGSRLGGGTAVDGTRVGHIPADFDVASFTRNAKDQFMALQAANDAKDLDRLRDYLSPEMFDLVRQDIAERGDLAQKTEVFGLQSQVLDVAEEAGSYVVSVRFTGSTRDQAGAAPDVLDETWHLVKPKSGFGGWVIAGIQQNA